MSKDISILNPPTLDSVESTSTKPIISTDDSTTETNTVEVATTKKTSTTKPKTTRAPRSTSTKSKTATKKPTKNKIDLSFFDEQEKLIDTMLTYTYEDGTTIDYYPVFDQLKKDTLIGELVNTVAYCEENNIDYLKTQGALYQYTYFLCIKYFTELYPHFEGLSVEDHIAYCVKLYKTGHYETFISEILPFEELQKVMEMLKITEQTAHQIAKDIALRNKQIDETIQSPILKDKLKNGLVN